MTKWPMPPFDLIVEPQDDGMVRVWVKLGAGLVALEDILVHKPDIGFATGWLCQRCAREALAPIMRRTEVPIAASVGCDGYLVSLPSPDERLALLDRFGEHLH